MSGDELEILPAAPVVIQPPTHIGLPPPDSGDKSSIGVLASPLLSNCQYNKPQKEPDLEQIGLALRTSPLIPCPSFHNVYGYGIIDGMYELFEHTADLGLRIRADDLNRLFAEAAECLFAAVLEDIGSVQPVTLITIDLSGSDREFLLFDWLRELLMRCDSDHIVFGRFEVQVRDDGLTGTAWGEAIDPNRHLFAHEVKAITYHELKVERSGEDWLAEVIVDI